MPFEPSVQVPFAVAVDLVVLAVHRSALRTLVVRRGESLDRGRWALPGGFVGAQEDLEAAAARELKEKTGLSVHVAGNGDAAHLEQLATYGDPGRDPRTRVLSVAHLVLVSGLGEGQESYTGVVRGSVLGDAAGGEPEVRWVPVDELLPGGSEVHRRSAPSLLAFDHDRILAEGVDRARAKIEYSSLATSFCPPEFTVGELRRVYEAVWGVALDPRNFHRKVTGTPGFLVPTGGTTSRQGGRPAQLFRVGGATLLNPPMLRPEA